MIPLRLFLFFNYTTNKGVMSNYSCAFQGIARVKPPPDGKAQKERHDLLVMSFFLAGGDNLEPRMRKPCAATISIFRVLSLHMFLQLFVLALNRFEAICQGRIDIGLTSQYHLQIVLCPLELILILLSSLFVCRNTFPVGWHPHQPK